MRAQWSVVILAAILDLVHGDHVCHGNGTHLGTPGQRSTEILSRRRRLAFPKGSTFVMTVSILQAIPVRLPASWNLAFEFDVIWPIPHEEDFRKKFYRKKSSWTVKRRHRRELYATFETALDSRNLPGRQCMLRTICEAKMLLSPPGVSFIEDAVRLILSNVDNVQEVDPYDIAYRTEVPCDVAYPCPVPLLELLLIHLYSDDLG
ncbi:uncharacterized protein LOC143430767 [Xylocopa sonorina]|uniref:uncharacterized protein LOC143430767 n=1 Tax=Xylocopa sonorina TaxID=1818115 RepID=UPI00403AD2F0